MHSERAATDVQDRQSGLLDWLESHRMPLHREERRRALQAEAVASVQRGTPLSHIPTHRQSREVRLAALRINGMALAAIARTQRTDEIRLAALESNARAVTLLTAQEVLESPRTAQWLVQNWKKVLPMFSQAAGNTAAIEIGRAAVKASKDLVFEGAQHSLKDAEATDATRPRQRA